MTFFSGKGVFKARFFYKKRAFLGAFALLFGRCGANARRKAHDLRFWGKSFRFVSPRRALKGAPRRLLVGLWPTFF